MKGATTSKTLSRKKGVTGSTLHIGMVPIACLVWMCCFMLFGFQGQTLKHRKTNSDMESATSVALQEFLTEEAIPSMNVLSQLPVDGYKQGPLSFTGKNENDGLSWAAPFVTFAIPCALQRHTTLMRTLDSILNQTSHAGWEAIVGIDYARVLRPPEDPDRNVTIAREIKNLQQLTHNDPRIRYQVITTTTTWRGRKKNGSGLVRNKIVQDFVHTEWVAFVDDDDTVAPNYVEKLSTILRANQEQREQHQSIQSNESTQNNRPVDIILFRMQSHGSRADKSDDKDPTQPVQILPDPNLDPQSHPLERGDFGISYTVRRRVFDRRETCFSRGHDAEDSLFVQQAFSQGLRVQLSPCLVYFVRQLPIPVLDLPESTVYCGSALQDVTVTPPSPLAKWGSAS